jgi:FlaA1/EpsC-like NDP-sugar epimerase
MRQNDRTLSHVFSAFCDFVINLISVLVALLIIKEAYGESVGGTAVAISVGIAIFTVAVYFVFDLYSTKVFTKLHKQILRILVAQLLISAITFVCLAIFIGKREYYFVELISVGISTTLVITKKILSMWYN